MNYCGQIVKITICPHVEYNFDVVTLPTGMKPAVRLHANILVFCGCDVL